MPRNKEMTKSPKQTKSQLLEKLMIQSTILVNARGCLQNYLADPEAWAVFVQICDYLEWPRNFHQTKAQWNYKEMK